MPKKFYRIDPWTGLEFLFHHYFFNFSCLFEDKSNPFISNFKLRGTDNVYTQHRPLITKDILPGIFHNIKNKAGFTRQRFSAQYDKKIEKFNFLELTLS